MSDVIVIGAGAAGLATSIFAARSGARIVCLEGARRPGAKIVVSGGGRCNVTNREVIERDFWGGPSPVVRRVLKAFPASQAAEFFALAGVSLHEEENGKLFPDSGRSRDVVDALLTEAGRAGVDLRTSWRVESVRRSGSAFVVRSTGGETCDAPRVVLATGGLALPKSGSDGFGYQVARAFGHEIVETTPALAPLLVDDPLCARLSGVSVPAELRLRVDQKVSTTLSGALLFTHFGMSGPLALNMSRHWLRASLEIRPELELSLCPGETFESVEQWILGRGSARPRALVTTVLSERLPQTVAETWVERAGVGSDTTMAHLEREGRRTLTRALVACPVPITGSRGYSYAEVTAGGVALSEIDPATMESRRCRGLYLVGEVLDIDGRLGGFNFQWAWSSGWVAGQALGRAIREPAGEG